MRASELISADTIKEFARECGFELAGIASAEPHADFARYEAWRASGMAAEMAYLTDHRGDKRSDPRTLLPNVQSIVCVGKLYNAAYPYSTQDADPSRGWVSRYAWGEDYHDILRGSLKRLVAAIQSAHEGPFDWKICVDTAPLLERSYARQAGLGWIGRNTCLINQQQGSWFFLGELLLSIPLAPDAPAPERCGTCRRCIDACPTVAIVPDGDGNYRLDARRCISYLTIEKRGEIPGDLQEGMGRHIFGCDICQDVCPWNGRAAETGEEAFQPIDYAPSLLQLSATTQAEFGEKYGRSPVSRARYSGFLRNVAIAMGNSGQPEFNVPLRELAEYRDAAVSGAAKRAITGLCAAG